MKKRIIFVLGIIMCMILSVGIFTACATKKDASQKYTISFYADEELVFTLKTAGNEEIGLPDAPKKEGFTFDGWYSDKGTWENELMQDTFSERALTENIDVYAHYIPTDTPLPSEYTITFYIDGSASDAIQTSGNETLTLPSAPNKDNYTFEGWFFDNGTWKNELTETTYADKPLTTDVSVYAYYKKTEATDPEPPQKYTVRFDTNDGTAVNDMTVSTIAKSPVTTKKGYTFVGWYTESSFTNKVTFPYEVTKAQTLYAKWEKNKYTVQFDTDGGTAVSDMTVSTIAKSPVTTKKGYTFVGWYTESSFTKEVTFPYEVTKAQTLYAKWEQNGPEEIVFSVDGNGVLTGVSGLTENNTDVVIPSVVDGITVKEIGMGVFKDNRNIVSLTIPDSVTTLQNRICSGCTALREVRLPSGLTVIPDETFDGCSSLSTVHFPNTLRQIRSDAFCGTGLTKFIAPDSLTAIWGNAFKDCAKLTKVDLKNVSSVSGGAFQSCTALRSVRLSDELTELPGHLFDGCASLAEIDMPDRPIAISAFILNGTAYYNDKSNWEKGVLYADDYLIAADKTFASETEYAVKADTLVIADNAFSNVGYSAKLRKMTLPDRLYRIGQYAFSNLYSLTEINIPASVRSVGYGAFSGTGYDTAQKYSDGGLYVGNWLVAVQKVAMQSFTVREGTVGVADGRDSSLFPTKAQAVTQLTLPSSLQYIGARSFARLRNITDLKLPSELRTLGEGAFEGCLSLRTVNLGECTKLESVGGAAFKEAAISEITVPASVVSMGELVFNLNKVNLTIHCEASEQRSGWNDKWSYSYRQGVTIMVEWKNS